MSSARVSEASCGYLAGAGNVITNVLTYLSQQDAFRERQRTARSGMMSTLSIVCQSQPT